MEQHSLWGWWAQSNLRSPGDVRFGEVQQELPAVWWCVEKEGRASGVACPCGAVGGTGTIPWGPTVGLGGAEGGLV